MLSRNILSEESQQLAVEYTISKANNEIKAGRLCF